MNEPGLPPLRCRLPRFPRASTRCRTVHPRRRGQRHAAAPRRAVRLQRPARSPTPTSSCVYWAGGNPFHHHQDISAAAARAGPTRHRRRARPVLDGDGQARRHRRAVDHLVRTRRLLRLHERPRADGDARAGRAYAQSRDDYQTFAALADRLGFGEQFTEGRTARAVAGPPLRELVRRTRFRGAVVRRVLARPAACGCRPKTGLTLLADFRADPAAHPLGTPSGRSRSSPPTSTVSATTTARAIRRGSNPTEWLGGPRAAHYPLHLLANQPATRLHSQLDGGAASQNSKVPAANRSG